MSHLTHNRSFRRQVFPGNQLHWYWQPKNKDTKHNIHSKHKRVTEKIVLANRTIRTIYTLIWYALYDLRPRNYVGPILTTLRPNEATSFTISHKNFLFIAAPLPSARQHPSYGDCLEVKREYYQNCSVLDCVTQCSQSTAHLCEQFLQVQQIGFVTLGPLRCA